MELNSIRWANSIPVFGHNVQVLRSQGKYKISRKWMLAANVSQILDWVKP